MAYFEEVIVVRCSRQLYEKFNTERKKNPELESFSHAVRVAMIQYIRYLKNRPKNAV